MIVCSNCNHQNPEGSIQCENCYTPLPLTTPCPNCGAIVQTDATFCGQCGFNLQAHHINNQDEVLTNPFTFLEDDREDLPLENNIPTAVGDSPMVSPWDEETTEDITFGQAMPVNDTEIMNASSSSFIAETPWESKASESEEMPWEMVNSTSNSEILELSDVDMSDSEISEAIPELPDIDQIEEMPDLSDLESSELEMREEMPDLSDFESSELEMREEMPELPDFESSELEMREEMPELPDLESSELEMGEEMPELPDLDASELEMSGAVPELPDLEPSEAIDFGITTVEADASSATQLQIQQASLLHIQTSAVVEIPQEFDVIHIGKPNSQIPPDVDVSEFPNSEVVSRIHADIRVEGDTYFIEDVGSSNGTYINHVPLLRGNRHRLRTGDRIALGKGDLVTFIFQIK